MWCLYVEKFKILLNEKVWTHRSRIVDMPLDVTIKWRVQQKNWKSTRTYKMDSLNLLFYFYHKMFYLGSLVFLGCLVHFNYCFSWLLVLYLFALSLGLSSLSGFCLTIHLYFTFHLNFLFTSKLYSLGNQI